MYKIIFPLCLPNQLSQKWGYKQAVATIKFRFNNFSLAPRTVKAKLGIKRKGISLVKHQIAQFYNYMCQFNCIFSEMFSCSYGNKRNMSFFMA